MLLLGHLAKIQGLKGEFLLHEIMDEPEKLAQVKGLVLAPPSLNLEDTDRLPAEARAVTVRSFRWHQDPDNASLDVAGVPVRLRGQPQAINWVGRFGDYDVVDEGLPLTAGSAGMIYGFPGGAAFLRSAPIARGFSLASDYRLNPYAFHVDGVGGAGCSGGPVVLRAERGDRTLIQWIGIYVATYEAERLGRCIPLERVMELVETMVAEPDLWPA